MSTTTKLNMNAFGKDIEQNLYKSMIGSLLYLTVSHPDIFFNVRACPRYKESHLTSIKRIICYINGNLDYGLEYPYDSSLLIASYFNVD